MLATQLSLSGAACLLVQCWGPRATCGLGCWRIRLARRPFGATSWGLFREALEAQQLVLAVGAHGGVRAEPRVAGRAARRLTLSYGGYPHRREQRFAICAMLWQRQWRQSLGGHPSPLTSDPAQRWTWAGGRAVGTRDRSRQSTSTSLPAQRRMDWEVPALRVRPRASPGWRRGQRFRLTGVQPGTSRSICRGWPPSRTDIRSRRRGRLSAVQSEQ